MRKWYLAAFCLRVLVDDLGKKSDFPPDIFQWRLKEIMSTFDGYQRMYTDCLKESVAAAAVSVASVRIRRLPNNSFIFAAEAQAVDPIYHE
jgi:hypothetical protein